MCVYTFHLFFSPSRTCGQRPCFPRNSKDNIHPGNDHASRVTQRTVSTRWRICPNINQVLGWRHEGCQLQGHPSSRHGGFCSRRGDVGDILHHDTSELFIGNPEPASRQDVNYLHDLPKMQTQTWNNGPVVSAEDAGLLHSDPMTRTVGATLCPESNPGRCATIDKESGINPLTDGHYIKQNIQFQQKRCVNDSSTPCSSINIKGVLSCANFSPQNLHMTLQTAKALTLCPSDQKGGVWGMNPISCFIKTGGAVEEEETRPSTTSCLRTHPAMETPGSSRMNIPLKHH